ncbi:MAG: ABC transporter ATP-binding protein [Candidatus Hodarchaeota archaeon]
MDDDIAIKVNHVSKKYCKSLKRSMLYGLKDIARNTLGLSSHSDRLRKEEFWAVNDVSFELRRGETLGVIGPNGSGKTTLLKMLNGIFWPDKGKITIRGSVSALIEVGAGFHPMLTGRENIYINGAILGMNKKEINEKFDDIVKFADIGDFIDVPVKFYSSGMFVRLGFAVAAHCEPDILLVDEILAVGDVEFQSKCLNFMTENVLKKGCSLIMVSHNRYAIQDVCERALYLKNGKMVQIGDALNVIELYLDDIRWGEKKNKKTPPGTFYYEDRGITKVVIMDKDGNIKNKFKSGEEVYLRFYYSFKNRVQKPSIAISLFHSDPRYKLVSSTDYVFNLHSGYDGFEIQALQGKGYFEVAINCLYLPVGTYTFSIYLFLENMMNLVQKYENAGEIEILWLDNSSKRSLIELPHKWKIEEDKKSYEIH